MKRILSFYVCFALCMALFAQATDLTIDCQTPGGLSSKINYGDQQTVKNLKVTGYITNTDLAFIGSLTQLSLNGVIDLGDVTIVSNFWDGNFKHAASAPRSYDSNLRIFYEDYTYSLQKLILPHNLASYLENKYISQSYVDTLVFDTQVNKIGDYCYAYYSSYYNNSGKDNDSQYTFRRQIGHLILGENVDSLMYLPSDYPLTVHLPNSLKCIASYACKGRKDLSKWNI